MEILKQTKKAEHAFRFSIELTALVIIILFAAFFLFIYIGKRLVSKFHRICYVRNIAVLTEFTAAIPGVLFAKTLVPVGFTHSFFTTFLSWNGYSFCSWRACLCWNIKLNRNIL